MSGFDLITSGILSGPDVTDSPDVRGVMTPSGSKVDRHSRSMKSTGATCSGRVAR